MTSLRKQARKETKWNKPIKTGKVGQIESTQEDRNKSKYVNNHNKSNTLKSPGKRWVLSLGLEMQVTICF